MSRTHTVPPLHLSPSPLTLPHILAPSSRPSSPSFNTGVTTLSTQLNSSLAEYRRTGNLALAHQTVLPPLISTWSNGHYETSPWKWRAEEGGKTHEEREEGGMKKGIPRDVQEWDEWEKEKKEKQKVKLGKRKVSTTASTSNSHSSPARRTTTASSPPSQSSSASAVPPTKKLKSNTTTTSSTSQQANLLTGFSSSTKPHLIANIGASAKPTPSSSSSANNAAAQKDPTAIELGGGKEQKQTNGNGKGPYTSTPAAGIGGGGGARQEQLEGGGGGAVFPDYSRESGNEGRSLGEDEEILFEQGFSQMILPDPTPHHTSPPPPSSPAIIAPAVPSHHSPTPPPSRRTISPIPLPPISSAALFTNLSAEGGNSQDRDEVLMGKVAEEIAKVVQGDVEGL